MLKIRRNCRYLFSTFRFGAGGGGGGGGRRCGTGGDVRQVKSGIRVLSVRKSAKSANFTQ